MNRSQVLKKEIEFSQSTQETAKRKARRRDGDWRSDLDAELSRYFAGDYVGDAGLRSGFGYQLERQRDGVSFTGSGFVMPSPPRGIELHGPARLEVVRVHAALVKIQEMAIEAAREKVKERAKKSPNATREDIENDLMDATDDALMAARKHISVLRAYYSRFATGEYVGLIGLEPFGMVAPLTAPIVAATRKWMAEELQKELAHASSAATMSALESDERMKDWKSDLVQWSAELNRYEREGDEPERQIIFLTRRRSLQREIEELTAQIRAASEPQARIDVQAIIRAKWQREPTYYECRAILRKANEAQKPTHIASPELRATAKKLVDEAMGAARRDLGAARAAYSVARGAGKRMTKKQAILSEYDERHGL